ncbi:succinate dehydrogenase assembly factor 2 [Maribius pontilimi]|uniref:FAD assembly factor SdhE n=1 Tax=Palleronia pontilimi TaxID=1964209 RepID=A0A934IE14_9RHOB|nr:succinate dehydrogenase assembly factor 2 [Palleronia pontilimi]MBJ3762727.1 succinate dehydrogenase assembly factor 2 [Palleronia pontilimi]
MSGVDDITLRRLKMRSMRRGIKEMDLILSAYADGRLAELSPETVALYEEMLFENDQELYTWVSGQVAPPDRFAALVDDIRAHMARHVQKNDAS